MAAIDHEHILAWLRALGEIYATNKERLTQLDAAVGDADHGINLERGYAAVSQEIEKLTARDIGATLNMVATTLIRTVGGASGPLYGTFFLRASAVCTGKEELSAEDVVALFEAGIAGVSQRGKAVLGEKTMLDALIPAALAMKQATARGAAIGEILREGAVAAKQGVEDTVALRATKGRASYLGERSIGHPDPGATSSYLLVQAAADAWVAQ